MADDLDRVVARVDGKRTEPVPTFDPQRLDYVALLRDRDPARGLRARAVPGRRHERVGRRSVHLGQVDVGPGGLLRALPARCTGDLHLPGEPTARSTSPGSGSCSQTPRASPSTTTRGSTSRYRYVSRTT